MGSKDGKRRCVQRLVGGEETGVGRRNVTGREQNRAALVMDTMKEQKSRADGGKRAG